MQQRSKPTISEHIAATREQRRLMEHESEPSKRLRYALACLDNLTSATEKLYQQNTELRLRLEDLEDAEINRK